MVGVGKPRKYFADVEMLAESIRAEGLLEPIMVRPLDGRYQIVHGERRFRAASLAELMYVMAQRLIALEARVAELAE